MAIRIVHTADLHLDRAFTGLGHVPDWLAPQLAKAACASWDRTVELALDVDADAFVAVGGLPGAEGPCAEAAVWRFVAGLERLAAARIPTLLVPGPHEGPVSLPPGWHPPGHVQCSPPVRKWVPRCGWKVALTCAFLSVPAVWPRPRHSTAVPLLAVAAARGPARARRPQR